MDKVTRTDAEWRETPFTGKYTDTKIEGVYRCRAYGAERS